MACAERGDAVGADLQRQQGGARIEVSDWTTHYNSKTERCYVLIGYYGSGFAQPYQESIDQAPPLVSREVEIAAAAGAVFGLVYWLIAGRNAGRWRERA